ncbi:esterase-like activity of phytase family protein [Actinokineospora diospyrosa]|uniref:esterase-like activity of phytase family protein n=1 Tax=Actinokineospora diospyrosa TaxID=103728 RepID=UPI0020A2369E|nr:esterase-like activity of phytase family protein [Actinokineospora diospyrosa]
MGNRGGGWVRALATVALVVWLCVTGASAALAQPPAPTDACVQSDKRLGELSGLATDGERWYAINDGGTKSTVYVLGHDCKIQKVINGPTDPFDVEDLARDAKGNFWLADTGDNDKKRETVALIELTPAGKTTLHRLTYPDGPHDTEALLLDKNGTPHLVTKSPFGVSEVYRPKGPLAAPGPTALEKVGDVQISSTDTKGGPVNPAIGSMVVTGGSVSLDGTIVVLRTYTDAYLYPAPDGDVVAALKRTPARVPLPDEKQGEAIAIEPDGTLVSGSEGVGTPIRVVKGASGLLATTTPAPGTSTGAPTTGTGGSTEASDGMSTVPALGIAAVAIGGALFFMHRRAAKRG